MLHYKKCIMLRILILCQCLAGYITTLIMCTICVTLRLLKNYYSHHTETLLQVMVKSNSIIYYVSYSIQCHDSVVPHSEVSGPRCIIFIAIYFCRSWSFIYANYNNINYVSQIPACYISLYNCINYHATN